MSGLIRSSRSGPATPETLAILFTFTTYGTWPRGDQRGWVDEGRTLPPDPQLEAADRQRMNHEPFLFSAEQLHDIGAAIGKSLTNRLQLKILALAVRRWHIHFVIGATRHDVSVVAKCAKESVRYHMRPGRPIWTDGYDKRFCFDEQSVFHRIAYVERHNTELGLPARPWDFIEDWRM